MAGPDLLAFTFIGKTALTKRAIDLLAGNGSFLSVSNLLTRRTAAVPRSRAQAFALPPNTPRPWPRA